MVLVYAAVLGGFLASTRGLPFALDNLETFSSFVHGRNLLRFGVRETFGLTDEAYGLDRAQHPYVYTHGGNFPRLYSLVLYAMGARTVEAQIVATTFTVGLLGMLFAFRYFSRVGSPWFALTYCLLLTTDYVLQTQWLFNTWRVWHHFFVFSSLLLVHGLARRGRIPPWLALTTLLNFACLAYFELVFATFVTLLCTIYASFVCRRRWGRMLQSWLLLGGGATLGAAVLAGQVIGYLGRDGFVQDTKLTFLARNVVPKDMIAFRRNVWAFVEEHHLVFWDNMSRGVGDDRTVPALFQVVFRWSLEPYTPVLVFVVLLIASGWALSFVADYDVVRVPSASGRIRRLERNWALPSLLAAACAFVWATLRDRTFAGLSGGGRWWEAVGPGILAFGLVGIGVVAYRRLRRQDLGLPASRVVGASALLIAFAAFARVHPSLYDIGPGPSGAAFEPQSLELFARSGGGAVWRLGALLGAALAVGLVLGKRSLMGRDARRFKRLFQFVVSGVLAWIAVFWLSPGYVTTGYLMRYCPMTVYVHLVPFAAAFYVLSRTCWTSLKALHTPSDAAPPWAPSAGRAVEPERGPGLDPSLAAPVGVLLLCLLSAYWLILQVHYVQWINPNLTLLRELKKPQYQGASFVANVYAVPMAAITDGWAYFDREMGRSEVRNLNGRFYMARDFRYLWFADKRSNTKYLEPDYFVCWRLRTLLNRPTCDNVRIVDEARGGTSVLGNREVARDESGGDAWSIVKLNWTYPPGSGEKIQWHNRQYRRALALPN